MALPRMLAGPIVRRVELDGCSFRITLSGQVPWATETAGVALLLWLGCRARAGHGEGSSGLAWDTTEPLPAAPRVQLKRSSCTHS